MWRRYCDAGLSGAFMTTNPEGSPCKPSINQLYHITLTSSSPTQLISHSKTNTPNTPPTRHGREEPATCDPAPSLSRAPRHASCGSVPLTCSEIPIGTRLTRNMRTFRRNAKHEIVLQVVQFRAPAGRACMINVPKSLPYPTSVANGIM